MKKYAILGLILIVIIIGIVLFVYNKEINTPTERENVENYLKENISKLSPVKAVLGGTWYVLSYTVDLTKKTGTVTYEDGHIQEKKNFTYTINEKFEVVSMSIK